MFTSEACITQHKPMVCNFKARKVNKVNNENYIKAKSGVISIQIVMMLVILI